MLILHSEKLKDMKKFTFVFVCALVALVFASCKKDQLSTLELKFSQESVTIDEGGDEDLKKYLVITPQNVADTLTVNWKSSDESVAYMFDKGWVVGASKGETTVTAEAYGKSASIKVIVNELPITALTIKADYNGIVNVPIVIDGVALQPSGASLGRINWRCSSDKVTFHYNSEKRQWSVKASEAGTYTITAQAGDLEAKCNVTATKSAPVESFSLSAQSKSLKSGESFTLSVKDIYPATASAEYIRWECDSPEDVTLSTTMGASCTITAKVKDEKTVKIKAIAPNGYENVCTVTITIIPVLSISFENGTDLIVFAGKTYNLPKVKVNPNNATKASDVEYTVSDPAVSAVEGESSVVYTVSSSIGGDAKTCTVTAKCGGKTASFVMYAVPSNYMSRITPESAYSEFGTFGMGDKSLKPTQLIKSEYKSSPVASKLKMRYSSTSGSATKAIIETETYSTGSEFSEYKYDYNYNIASATPTSNKTNVVFKLVLSDMNGDKLVSGSLNTYFYNSVVKYTYETVQMKNSKITTVKGDISPSETLNLNIVRDASAQKIYAPAVIIYAVYYTNSGKTETSSYKASYSSRTDYYDVHQDITCNMKIFSSDATKSKTGTVDFTVKFKK